MRKPQPGTCHFRLVGAFSCGRSRRPSPTGKVREIQIVSSSPGPLLAVKDLRPLLIWQRPLSRGPDTATCPIPDLANRGILLRCEFSRPLLSPHLRPLPSPLAPLVHADSSVTGLTADLPAHQRQSINVLLGDGPSGQINDQLGPLGDISRASRRITCHVLAGRSLEV